MSMNFDRAATVVIAVAAVAMASVRIYASFYPTPLMVDRSGPPQFVSAWSEAMTIGRSVEGTSASPIKIVTFVDYECPFCAQFHTTLQEVAQERPNDFEVIHVHYPLTGIHRFAMPAAKGAECAAAVGKYSEWVDILYQKQDSLGLKPWADFAHEVGIDDATRIHDCATAVDSNDMVSAAIEFGGRIGVSSTPTVLVNGWMYPGPPSRERLIGAIDALLNGRDPT